jgi:7-keto-8-aminopelargonate synthetase-like enzyme
MGALDYLKDELAKLGDDGLLLHARTLEGATGARARFDGRDVINLASNNYLGLANHPACQRGGVDGGARAGRGERRGADDRGARCPCIASSSDASPTSSTRTRR